MKDTELIKFRVLILEHHFWYTSLHFYIRSNVGDLHELTVVCRSGLVIQKIM